MYLPGTALRRSPRPHTTTEPLLLLLFQIVQKRFSTISQTFDRQFHHCLRWPFLFCWQGQQILSETGYCFHITVTDKIDSGSKGSYEPMLLRSIILHNQQQQLYTRYLVTKAIRHTRFQLFICVLRIRNSKIKLKDRPNLLAQVAV